MTSTIVFYSLILSNVFIMFIGAIYDILGRKLTIFISIFSSGLLLFLIPLSAPHIFPNLLIIRMAIGITFIAPNC